MGNKIQVLENYFFENKYLITNLFEKNENLFIATEKKLIKQLVLKVNIRLK